jgi:putative sterol carrier protein
MPYTTTTQQLFTNVVPAYLKGTPAGDDVEGAVLFQIEGRTGGTWLVDFRARTVTEGNLPPGSTVKAVVKAQDRDFMALVEGRMSPDDGLLTKRLQLAGDAVALAQLMDAFAKLRATL